MRKTVLISSIIASAITLSEAKKGRCNWPILAPKVEMSCDSNKPKQGTVCSLSCPEGFKLAAPAETTCECRGSNCDWTHGKYRPSCITIVQGWGRDKAEKKPGFRELSSFANQIKELELPPIVEMNGNSKSIFTTIRPKTLRPKTTTTMQTTTPESLNGGRNFDEEHENVPEIEILTCPELPPMDEAVLKCSNGNFDNSKCQYRCSSPGSTLEPHPRRSLRCQCDANTKSCAWQNKLAESTLCKRVPSVYQCSEVLPAQNNHTQVECTNGALAGSVCTWKCDNFYKLNKKGKSIRCKCKRDKVSEDPSDFACKWNNEVSANDESRFCAPKGGYLKNLRKQVNSLGRGDGNEEKNEEAINDLKEKIEEAKKWM